MTKLPEIRGWRILVRKQKPKEVTSGGILLSDASKDAESYLNVTAQVVQCGPLCWHERDTGQPWPGGAWAKPGDWVIIPKFTQFKMEIEGEEYRIINDDEVIAVVDDPTIIKVYS